jgi:2-haloacid dehalogenase
MHDLLDRFAEIVVSGREGVTKPDPEIFLLACSRLGVAPESVVFVDDSPANVAGAEAVGMTGLLFRSAEQLRADLVASGLLA